MPVLKARKNGEWVAVGGMSGSINADTVDGMHANEFASASEVEYLKSLIGGSTVSEQIGVALVDIEAQLSDLMYEEIEISSFTMGNIKLSSGASATVPVELGSTVTSVTLNWLTNKDPKALTLDGAEINAGLSIYIYDNLNVNSNKTFTLKATDERDATATRNVVLSFCNRVCYGVAAAPDVINSDFVMSLATKTLTTTRVNGNVKYDAGTNEYLWYCVPVRLGACSFTDVETGLGAGMTLAATIEVTNASGYKEDYYVYKSNYASLGSLTIKVS